MYIPSLLYGAANSCVTARGTTDSGSFASGSQIWNYYKYSNVGSASFEVLAGSTVDARIFMVAGGGGGGYSLDNSIGGLSAGGGGAGGVVFTTARLGTGTYPLYVGSGSDAATFVNSGSGEESWIDIDPALIPSSYLSYFTSGSRLTAEGGGSGAWFTDLANGFGSGTGKVDASGGGSGGGGIQALRWTNPAGTGIVVGQRGGGRNPQGNNGGISDGFLCQVGGTETTATGGGGAKSGSANTDCEFSDGYQTPGGEGEFYNVNGLATQYAYGGASMRSGVWEAAPYDSGSAVSRVPGAGGWGTSDLYTATTDKEKGVKGEIVLIVPICQTETTECTTYTVTGGATGGNLTYVPCGANDITSSAIVAGSTVDVCSFPITGTYPYPSGSGTVNFSAGTSCNEFIGLPTASLIPPCDCRVTRFTAGSSAGSYLARYYPCGISQSSYDTDQFVASQSMAPNEVFTTCTVSGSFKGMSGFGSTAVILGTCTSSLALCN